MTCPCGGGDIDRDGFMSPHMPDCEEYMNETELITQALRHQIAEQARHAKLEIRIIAAHARRSVDDLYFKALKGRRWITIS